MKTIGRCAQLAAGFGALCALISTGSLASADPSRSDIRFMREAAQGGMAEVRMGELAKERGATDRVREFGQRMIDDHSKANDDLKDLASRKGVTLPADIGADNRAVLSQLRRLHGSAFDAAYIRHMRMDHQMDVAAFRREAENGRDPDVRHFAQDKLPIIRDHYNQISRMAEHRWRMGRL